MRILSVALLLLLGRGALAQTVVVRDAGPGSTGRELEALLRKPDTRVIIADTVRFARDSSYPAAVVVIGRRAELNGHVGGDLVVVGGDLFVKPGGRIDGQGIAIGGGAYPSLLGKVRGGLVSHRDFTFEATQTASGLELRYRTLYAPAQTSAFQLPSLYGLRIPSYDRSNGLSLPIGPNLVLVGVTIEPRATYRSQLGRVDPSVHVNAPIGRKMWLDAFAGRESRSNEDWISTSLSNSLNSIISGRDERNWYRATGAKATLNRRFETPTLVSTYSAGAAFERATAVRPGALPTSSPWSLMERTDVEDGMYRPNPQIPGGDITSATAAAAYRWDLGRVKARLDVDLEAPISVSTGENFVQGTTDGRIEFPTFGLHTYRFEVHTVTTLGDTPAQRFAYLGGSGTLPTQDTLLTLGGDQLLWLESRYAIPLPRVQVPLVGPPTLTFRHILGSAGLDGLPDLTQIIGVRASVRFLRAQWLMDTGTQKTKFSAGVSFSR